MSFVRLMLIGLIYALACAGWWILGATTSSRSTGSSARLGSEVQEMWGEPLLQQAPSLVIQIPGTQQVRWIMPERNEIKVALRQDHRKKGLIWYPTYTCDFDGVYTLTNAEQVSQKVRLTFAFPSKDGTYDNFQASLDENPLDTQVTTAEGIREIIELAPGQSRAFRVHYNTRGLRDWRYRSDPKAGRVRNLNVEVKTDFGNVDYVEGSLSPMSVQDSGPGRVLKWTAEDLITDKEIGVVIPEKINPGPLTARITFFAPVCLLFFFVLVATINIIYKVQIHPMHYLFVASGFFAFHLLLSYLVGVVNVHIAFLIATLTSVIMVTSYMSAALKGRFPWKVAAAGQLFYLILFSYSFFLKGLTGLTVAIGSVLTLAVLMWVTARIDWYGTFGRRPASEARQSPRPVPPPVPAG